jgi:hypothetical protein
MKKNHVTIAIILVLGTLILVFCCLSMENKENFTASPYSSSNELDKYYQGSTVGVEDYLVDNMTCHPSCCGDQWPVPFDGLTSGEIEKCIENRGKPGPFVRTNYTCANGLNGQGCPCIKTGPYKFLVNRGQNAHSVDEVEPTFIIRNDITKSNYEESPSEVIQNKRSMFRNQPKINDTELQREPVNLSRIQSYGSSRDKNQYADF